MNRRPVLTFVPGGLQGPKPARGPRLVLVFARTPADPDAFAVVGPLDSWGILHDNVVASGVETSGESLEVGYRSTHDGLWYVIGDEDHGYSDLMTWREDEVDGTLLPLRDFGA